MKPSNLAGCPAASVPPGAVISLRRFHVECECDGAPFVWHGEAVNEQAAIRCAAHHLAVRFPNVTAENVRATSVVEVAT